MMKNLKLLGVLLVGLFMPILVNAETCTENCVAQIGDTKYATVQEAITAVEDGGTVELLAGDISENISTGRIAKSFSIIGAANHATTLTGGLTIGTDHSSKPVQEYTVTIKGIVFKNNGIAVKDVKNVNIEDNKLYNIAEGAAIYIIDSAIHDVVSDVVAKNNIVDGANQGIRIRTGYNMEITDNIIKNTQHNSITIEHGSKWSGNNGTVVINNNTFENWALGGEGRVVRAHFGTATEFNKEISFTGNKMIREEEPVEEYAKFTGVGTVAVDFEKNYWNSDTPDFDKIILVEGGNNTVEIAEYYKAETMQDKDLNTYVEPPVAEAFVVLNHAGENGTLTFDKEEAVKGEVVTMTITPNEGYEIESVRIIDKDNNVIEVKDNKFIMPESDVWVSVKFSPIQVTEAPVVDKDNTIGVSDADKTEDVLLDTIAKDDKYKDLSVTVEVVVEDIKASKDIEKEFNKALEDDKKENGKIVSYFDILVAVKNTVTDKVEGYLTELTDKIEFTVTLPKLDEVKEGFVRNYYVIKKHGDKVEVIDAKVSKDGKSITFATDEFSTYALAYEDVAKEAGNTGVATPAVPQTFDGITATIIFASLALISLAGISLYFKKHLKNN